MRACDHVFTSRIYAYTKKWTWRFHAFFGLRLLLANCKMKYLPTRHAPPAYITFFHPFDIRYDYRLSLHLTFSNTAHRRLFPFLDCMFLSVDPYDFRLSPQKPYNLVCRFFLSTFRTPTSEPLSQCSGLIIRSTYYACKSIVIQLFHLLLADYRREHVPSPLLHLCVSLELDNSPF